MATLHLLLLVALPLCYAQFSIQGPSDGSRRSQGLKYDAQKGIQYDDQSASLDTGDFSIQGASDGNSNFQIQGASDGNANFQIQGASDGNANFQIQGATDDNSNFRIQVPTNGDDDDVQTQNTYGGNRGSGKSLQYQDPSGLQVNWKSYQPAGRAQQQQQDDYAPAPVAPLRRKGPRRQQQQQQVQQQQQEEPEPALKNYKVFNKAPPTIMQILQFQQQIPYLNSIPEHLRYDFQNAAAATANAPQPQAQEEPVEEIQRPLRNREKPRGSTRQKRLAQQKNQRQRISTQQQYTEPQPQLSTNVPSQIQNILQYQAKIPYLNHIPEQWRYEALLKKEGAQIQPQYQRQPEPEPIRHSQKVRQRRQAQKQQQQQQQQQYQEPQPHYNTNIPSHLQQILRFQSQVPYTNVIPEQFRYEKLAAAAQGHRQKRQAPKYQSQVDLSQYQRVSQPSIETLPKYSTNLPGPIKQLLQYQSQAPYDIIANRINYKLDKPYVPQPIVPAPISQIPQTNPRPLYKPIQQQQQQQPAQPIYQQPQLQSQFQPSQQFPYQQQQTQQRPLYQLAQNQYPAPSQQQQQQQPALTQLQRPIYQPLNQGQVSQYQQNNKAVLPSAPQSQLIVAQNHPNAISQYNINQARPYGQPANIVRPVTENQY